MEIKELNKTQLILLSLLITFVVSIATGIVTVSLMQQAPKSVPQTINNVIQRTIEKVTTVQVPVSDSDKNGIVDDEKKSAFLIADGNVMVSIYSADEKVSSTPVDTVPADGISEPDTSDNNTETKPEGEVAIKTPKLLGQGIIISDVGLILVESSILTGHSKYFVLLDETNFSASILKKFNNGFTVLRIISPQELEAQKAENKDNIEKTDQTIPPVDNQ